MLHKQTVKEIIQMASFLLGILAISIATAQIAHLHHHWVSDLLTHFQIQYAVGGFILFVFFAAFKNWKLSSLSLALGLFSAFQIYNSYDTPPPTALHTPAVYEDFKVIHHNRVYALKEHQDLLDFIKAENPNVVVIQEAQQSHSNTLKKLKQNYPYQIHEPQLNAFGMVVISKHPFVTKKIKTFDPVAFENIQIKIEISLGEQNISLYAIHPPPPTSYQLQKQRNMELKVTAQDIKNDNNSGIIMLGDWNISPFSPHFKGLMQDTNLKNYFPTGYLFPTWPSIYHLPVFQIPIDHVLHTKNFLLKEKRRGPAMGSDHYPVVATFDLYAQY